MARVDLETGDLRSLLDTLESGVALLDAEGVFRYVNGTIAAICGKDPASLVGRGADEALPALKGEIDWRHAARNVIRRGRSIRLARFALPGRVLDCALGPLRLARGDVALLTVTDVSEAVQLEERLLRQARTQAIANLGDSVAHEIRNPLNSIHMNVQLLREGLSGARLDRERLDRIATTVQREIKRLDGVVRDFVQYSRPPALRLDRGSLNHVVRAALDALDAQVREKQLRVRTDLQSARPVNMDKDRIQRAIYNVLLNAVQVLPEGGEIVCRSRDEERHCVLEISDNGPGIDPSKSSNIFTLFYTTKPGGTGLGLPIANRIVEEHGGRMAVASAPGKGATFAFFLPYEGPPPEPALGPTAVNATPGERPA
jgi:two-component system sensor histidine kinase HydH